MQRKTAIRQLAFAMGAVLLVPSCMQHKAKASILLKKINLNGEQEKLLAAICETIIPATDTPGARDISAHLFALMMVDDCYKKEDQENFIAGLDAFEATTKKQFNKSFIECSAAEKDTVVATLEAKKTSDEKLAYFYAAIKKLTIQAYATSKFYLTKVQVYQLVPGHYYGCVPVKKAF